MKLRAVGPYAALVASVLLIGLVQPSLAKDFSKLRTNSDVYALPAPEQTVVLSLGYRSALADYIYAHLRVAHGLHFEEKRRFEHVKDYLDVITTLDPKFAEPYLYADTFITVQPVPARFEDYEAARQVLLKGTRELPFNQQVWFVAGQFIAYIAPPNFNDEKLKQSWRLEGAKLLARACELATDNLNIPYQCLAAASLLNKAGEREALIQMLTRTLAVSDDEELQQQVLAVLGEWVGEQNRDREQQKLQAFQSAWAKDLRFVPKERLLLLGPGFDATSCAGREPQVVPSKECATSWRDWSRAGEH